MDEGAGEGGETREVGPSRSSLLDIAAPHCIGGACSECSGWPAQPL